MKTYSILAIDDEKDMLTTYESILKKKYHLSLAGNANEALISIESSEPDLILLDLRMPETDGLDLLKQIHPRFPEIDIIVVSASKDIIDAVEAMKLGAVDYIPKPFEVSELLITVEKALEKHALIKENLYLKEMLKESTSYCNLIGQSQVMKRVFGTIEKVAPTESTILIHGESGTGKELVARAIHQKSRRANKPFVAVNCAAIPENLLESELFGHERGSFTGAHDRKLGKFELADEGTLFLDEIGCMSAAMQSKLLRVLEHKIIERLGGEKGVKVDVRIISATNIDFQKSIDEGKFRADLYYRLNVIPVELPPLRERKDDLRLLAEFFIKKFNKELNKKILAIAEPALDDLDNYDWPGNVRELQNVIERAIVLSSGEIIEELNLPTGKGMTKPAAASSINKTLAEYEKELILEALRASKNNHSKAARQLGIPRSTLNSRMESLGLG
ncbi:MAG: sigma-54 dependent transcriptional regulator [Candidatus Margulisbacteria bacterium]|nr:sigma-54 dependent transcriptional regulator [Candidatus Margulisiibacteriota bacterium]MBU1617779.1 sigma-54 dependent transcriptional regulator [Candidatus Margulisiibacteriota bacterium]